MPTISVSVVSHGQNELVKHLVDDLVGLHRHDLEILITYNVPEAKIDTVGYADILEMFNEVPKGFGANHNYAAKVARGKYFCVINPDVRLLEDPFDTLIRTVAVPDVAIVGPKVVRDDGVLEDNTRRFVTVWTLARRILFSSYRRASLGKPVRFEPDWIAGMFMFFRKDMFQRLGGFDESFFLYYEDVDICARAWLKNFRVVFDPDVCVVHEARRASHRQIKYLVWHIKSIFRFLAKYPNTSRIRGKYDY